MLSSRLVRPFLSHSTDLSHSCRIDPCWIYRGGYHHLLNQSIGLRSQSSRAALNFSSDSKGELEHASKSIKSEEKHPANRKVAIFGTKDIRSTTHLNQSIEKWRLQKRKDGEGIKEILQWIDTQDPGKADPTTFALLLDEALSQKDESSTFMIRALFERLLTSLLKSDHSNCTLPTPIEWYFHKCMTRWAHDANQTEVAHRWLYTWWTCHEQNSGIFPRPTPEAYSIVMSGWNKEKDSHKAFSLLQDMHDRKHVQVDVSHYELCLNAFVRSVTHPKSGVSRKNGGGYDPEHVLLKMNNAGLLVTEGPVDSTGRSYQTRILQNLKKIVHFWVDSRDPDAPVRTTSILALMDDAYRNSTATFADKIALIEAYSHTIRAISFVATNRNNRIRKALASVSEDFVNPALHAENLLLRLEELVGPSDQQTKTTRKLWSRAYGSAIEAQGEAADKGQLPKKAQRVRCLWERYKRGYGEPDIGLYNHIFHVYGKLGDYSSSQALWEELMNDKKVKPDLKTLNWRLLSCKNDGRGISHDERKAKAKALWDTIPQLGFSPDIISYNTYLCIFIGTDDFATALEGDTVFHELLANQSHGINMATSVSLDAVLRMWSVFAKRTDKITEKSEALRHVILLLMQVDNLRSRGSLFIKPPQATNELVSSLLNINQVSEEKRVGVLRLLDRLADT